MSSPSDTRSAATGTDTELQPRRVAAITDPVDGTEAEAVRAGVAARAHARAPFALIAAERRPANTGSTLVLDNCCNK